MFRKKRADRVVVTLNPDEVRLLRVAMIEFRNRVIREGRPTEDIDRLILMICSR